MFSDLCFSRFDVFDERRAFAFQSRCDEYQRQHELVANHCLHDRIVVGTLEHRKVPGTRQQTFRELDLGAHSEHIEQQTTVARFVKLKRRRLQQFHRRRRTRRRMRTNDRSVRRQTGTQSIQ